MKLIKAEIKNFRLLHDVRITFDGNATSIVGKNNSGKTSLIKFLVYFLLDLGKVFSLKIFRWPVIIILSRPINAMMQ